MRSVNIALIAITAGIVAIMSACSKSSNENVQISKPPFQIGQPVNDDAPLSGNIKGTMLSGKTYTIGSDVTINVGDTLLLQPGVKVEVTNGATILVKGILLSLGTKDNPNWFTVPNVTKTDNANQDPTTDPAYQGKWTGINCDTTCPLLVIKWTHIEFGGAAFTNPPLAGYASGDPSFGIFYQNPEGIFVLEDSWIYGTANDGLRVAGGKFSILRNTFEKCGYTNGEAVNIKSGSVGDVAYNLFMGACTNGSKLSNAGATAIQANVREYNNTFVNCGWRQAETAHGGSINFEKQVKGVAYNNLMVNCRYGLRIVNSADTNNISYGNNYNYADTLGAANQFYPTGYVTHPQATDIPDPSSFLPAGYILGADYDGSSAVGVGNPEFVGYTLPDHQFVGTSFVGGADFHLNSNSPAIGKGHTGFSALAAVPVDSTYGASEIDQPGADIGCYLSDGSGNRH